MAQCLCLLHTGCLSFREHVYWPDGLQGLLWPKQNGFECVEDPHQVGEKVTRILNITFNAHHGSLCQSVLYVFLFLDRLSSTRELKEIQKKNASHVVVTTIDIKRKST